MANLLSVPALIDSSDERRVLARTSGAAAVDMETEFIARACAEHGVSLLSLRVITDTPHEPFPAPAHVLFDIERQRIDLLKLATFVIMHPSRLPRLVRFARRVAYTQKILTNALIEIVRNV
jgi:hypothetical protein